MRTTLLIVSSIVFAACAWGESSGPDTGDDDTTDPEIPVCGDGTCAASETNSCASDCGSPNPNPTTCNNNGTCDSGETQQNCATDCMTSGTVCGNNVCETGEDTNTCPDDCAPPTQLDCDDQFIQFMCGACIASGGDDCQGGTSMDACLECLQ